MIKKGILLLITLVAIQYNLLAQTVQIFGKVVDDKNKPVEFVNVYIQGSIEGATSLKDGTFNFKSSLPNKVVTLIASFMGYEPYSITDNIEKLNKITIKLNPESKNLDEIIVYAGDFLLKKSSNEEVKTAVDLVTIAGSEGDLYKAISLLPGAQVSGVDGRLLVRGGDSRETQTYIDGMHVLSPYTASVGNVGSRSRYSPFLFEGISFFMGGYSPEYS